MLDLTPTMPATGKYNCSVMLHLKLLGLGPNVNQFGLVLVLVLGNALFGSRKNLAYVYFGEETYQLWSNSINIILV